MSLTISEPFLPTQHQLSATQCLKEPYEWALGAICTFGGIACSMLQKVRFASDFTQETAASLIAFYEALPIQQKPLFETTGIARAREIKQWMEKGEGLRIISEITSLDLFGQNLTSLPPQIGLFVRLQNLDVSQNPLKTLSPELRNLSALKTITIDEIPNLTNLLPLGCKVQHLQEFTDEPQEDREQEISEAVRALKTPLEPVVPGEPVDLQRIVPNPKLRAVVTNLLQCEAFRTYWDQMLQEGMFRIRYATPTEGSYIMTHTAETVENRTILIREDEKLNDLPKMILFEVGNLTLVKNGLHAKAFPSADTFASYKETREYTTYANAHRLSTQLFEEGLVPQSQVWPFLGEEEYLALAEKLGHTDGYRDDWYKACDPVAGF